MKRYKVLAAMLALDEFSTDELEKISGVKIATVRTVIDRVKDNYLVCLGKKPSGHRGGQFKRYRVQKEKVHLLRAEIDELFNHILKTMDKKVLPDKALCCHF